MATDWRQHTEISTDRLQSVLIEGDKTRRSERAEVLAAIADSVARQQREIELQQNLVTLALRSCPRSGGFSALAADCPCAHGKSDSGKRSRRPSTCWRPAGGHSNLNSLKHCEKI